jgi:hypothetical protein
LKKENFKAVALEKRKEAIILQMDQRKQNRAKVISESNERYKKVVEKKPLY